ncbi:sigma-54-dependent Fis family transcriptional regulator [Methylomonas sp. MED-D]|uniref:sigma-54-dependent Fis family transcriptional regulator n=1 Tax=unclassified Methylomonas TaxID=2608980 RepID=UPI0028A57B5E|nr:sigma-54-dependent Fis family transcriptional regulator [Methylomonas sp. MV1]MDT4332045.1 sigma-54-dependent Fis family transcriptional regulator [Methylomonas sp. MV1]
MNNDLAAATCVLLVDDNPINLVELAALLEDAGYQVLSAETGDAAVDQAVAKRPDLILLDVLMPGIDGFTTCENLKAIPATRDIPVLFMTALADTADKVKGFHVGAVDYITKPFQHEEVLARVRTHLTLQKLKLELQEKEERLSRIFENAMDAILTLDQAGRITLFNAAAEQMFRCQAADTIGRSVDRFLAPELNKTLTNFRNGVPDKQAIWLSEGMAAVRADGGNFPIEATISRVEAAGQQLYILILRDINERKAREEAEAECNTLRGINLYLQEEVLASRDGEELIGNSVGLRQAMALVKQVAATDATVLITGETGTGKELIARAIHNLSGRKSKTLVKLNCATIPENLAESELFGHEKGAFTGAINRKLGRFELANGGTLFLDEIGELPLEIQAKLLRVLQEGEFERVGGTQTLKCDVRVIAATHRDLAQFSQEGKFRADLYYRMNVFPIHLPPLRERKEDIPPLVKHFINKYAAKFGKKITAIPERLMSDMQSYIWPGNIRELQHIIERAVILTNGSQLANVECVHASGGAVQANAPIATLDDAERAHILRALDATSWRIAGNQGAAKILGVPSTTLRSRMERLGIVKPLPR